jgi:sigma-B regulation protein RsbU (phosphoserine phosphatase)
MVPICDSVSLRWIFFRLPFPLRPIRPATLPVPLGFALLLILLASLFTQRTPLNKRRLREIDQELEIATRIQLSILLREMPQLNGLQVVALYLPMTSVAGNFYECLAVDSTRIGILIADVSGHGIPAALIASIVNRHFRATAPRR